MVWVSALLGCLLVGRWVHLWWVTASAWPRGGPRVGHWELQVVGLFVAYVVAVASWLLGLVRPAAAFAQQSPWRAALALTAMTIGVGLRYAGSKALGPAFAFTSASTGERLVTDGLYRFLKHPLLLGYCLEVVGLSCAGPTGVWFVICLGAATIALLVIEASLEERSLAARFGAEWSVYSRGKVL